MEIFILLVVAASYFSVGVYFAWLLEGDRS